MNTQSIRRYAHVVVLGMSREAWRVSSQCRELKAEGPGWTFDDHVISVAELPTHVNQHRSPVNLLIIGPEFKLLEIKSVARVFDRFKDLKPFVFLVGSVSWYRTEVRQAGYAVFVEKGILNALEVQWRGISKAKDVKLALRL